MNALTLTWLLAVTLVTPGLADPTYPSPVKKELYGQDLRGKQAPPLTAEVWLAGAAPVTKGMVVIVDFWATWCPPCRATIPELGEWQKKFSKDVVVIGISDEAEATVRAFMATTSMPYSVGLDPRNKMSRIVGVKGIPHILVITPDNVVRWQGFPLAEEEPLTEKVLQQIIDAWKAGAR